jgi:hypothetical protein
MSASTHKARGSTSTMFLAKAVVKDGRLHA